MSVSKLLSGVLVLAASLGAGNVVAEDFVVTTLRASPGKLPALIDAVKAYRTEHRGRVVIMRHTQGDHWDLLLLEPTPANPTRQHDFSALADFQHSFLAETGGTFKGLQHQAHENGLYHVEMFQALAGKRAALIDQRERENRYLADTGQVVNVVFTTVMGSDVDVFTIGFHESLAAFARGPTVSDVEAEAAAKDAGFESRGDIGFYLRSLLTRHNDTLAVPVD